MSNEKGLAVAVTITMGQLKQLLIEATRDAVADIIKRGGLLDVVKRDVVLALQEKAALFDEARASLLEQQRLIERTLSDTNDRLDRIDELYLSQVPRAAKKKRGRK